MIDLDAIKWRLSEMDDSEFVRRAPADIDTLLGEVERLREERDKAQIDAVNFGMQITAMAGEIEKRYRALGLSEVGLSPSDLEDPPSRPAAAGVVSRAMLMTWPCCATMAAMVPGPLAL